MLQDWMPSFYPGRMDLVDEARRLARELGGELHEPTLKWKYRPLEWILGYNAAVSASRLLPRLKATAARKWDEVGYRASAALRTGTPAAR